MRYGNVSAGGLKDVPEEEHYAILTFSSVYTPGDERSCTHPGHGYPAHTSPVSYYRVYKDRESWEVEIQRCIQRCIQTQQSFVPLVARKASVKSEITVEVGELEGL